MAFDFNEGSRRRDGELRRSILSALYHSRHVAKGGLSGRALVYVLPTGDAGLEGDDHAVKLIRDVERLGLAKVAPLTRRRGETFGPDHLFATITALGVQLVEEDVPPVPGVDDDRVAEGD